MKKNILIILTLTYVLTSCKKDYTCTCSLLGGPYYDVASYHDTKTHAKKKCQDDTKDLQETTCKIK